MWLGLLGNLLPATAGNMQVETVPPTRLSHTLADICKKKRSRHASTYPT